MKVAVLGLWHLGSVTAACTARHHDVIGLDFDAATVAGLETARAPLREPGLDELLAQGIKRGALRFAIDPAAIAAADLLWVCYDTPVNADDQSESEWVLERIARAIPALAPNTPVLVSSQLPVGSCARLAARFPHHPIACSPENLRLGKAIDAFEHPARIIVGAPVIARGVLEQLFAPLGAPLFWMRPESAEMVKHALNSFLALSIAFVNEIAALSETVGADAREVADGLKSEPRIGARAYLNPGGPFAGGTLARDVVTLTGLGAQQKVPLALIPAIKESNDRHRGWVARKLAPVLAGIAHPTVAVLGLAYTPGTSTLRRSSAVELCRTLAAGGVTVRAFDPLIRATDGDHHDLALFGNPADAVHGAHAVVICTEWPEFRNYDWPVLLAAMSRPVVIDANRHVEKVVAGHPGLLYLTVGRP
ncbi:MAG: hypothetical protein C0518_00490 [Opitutus sp.]|nr:hypothetical protein [Opitutus sp.]